MRQELTFNGKALSDFGVWFDGSVSFGSPERDVELVEVVGRNGALSISNDRFRNIEITFPCAIRTNFIDNYRNLMVFLNSSKGYCRLETTQEPNYYRLALFMNQTDPTGYKLNTHGRFDLVFQVMPQRFLKTGENWTTVSSSSSEISGNPVSIDNPSGLTALTGLSVDIQPVQDLNGYDHPWVGGAGDNLINIGSFNTGGTSGGVTVAVNASENYYTLNGTATDVNINYWFIGSYATGLNVLHLDAGTYYYKGINLYERDAPITSLTRGDVGDFFTLTTALDIDGIRCINATVGKTYNNEKIYPYLVKVNNTSVIPPFTPYENICPITGHTSASVARTGKNLLPSHAVGSTTISGVTFTVAEDGTITANGTATAVAIFAISTYTLAEGTYILNGCPSGGSNTTYYIDWRNDSGGQLTDKGNGSTQTSEGQTGKSCRIVIYNGQTVNNLVFNPMIRLASDTDATYEPYQGQTVTIDLNGTRYGGTLDVLTGVLTVTWGTITLDGSELWQGTPSSGWYTTLNTLKKYKSNYVGAIYADKLVTGREQGEISGYYDNRDAYPTQNWLYYYMNTFTSANEVKSYFQTNPTQIVYELATPITVQLTAQQVSLLTGTNIISTDMNSLTVTIASPAELENPTLFESKPIIRVYGNGTLNVNDQYITVANSPYTYIDIDCELMDCYHGSNNANQYVSFSTTDYVTLRSGMNYFSYSGFTSVQVTPRWFEI